MYKRIIDLEAFEGDSIFLLGARQTGKSTFLLDKFKDVPMFDLLDAGLRTRLGRSPGLLSEMLQDMPEGSLVIIDEIQKVPALLDEVHRLMTRKNLRFILCGSSARKLKKSSSNTLGGRAVPVFLSVCECLDPGFQTGPCYCQWNDTSSLLVDNAANRLKGYVDVYLKEEIIGEALVRDIDPFGRFL